MASYRTNVPLAPVSWDGRAISSEAKVNSASTGKCRALEVHLLKAYVVLFVGQGIGLERLEAALPQRDSIWHLERRTIYLRPPSPEVA